jgi:hypothetical protein
LPVFLYVETNFPIGYATGRSPGTDIILSNPPLSLQLIIPSICLMEALSVLEGERKRQRQWLEMLGQQSGQVKRNVISPLARPLAYHLDQARSKADDLGEEYETRLFHALNVLGLTAELIHPTREILTASRSNPPIKDPTDNLILASILDHSKNYPSETKIFLSENRRDFDTNPEAKLALQDSGVRYFADASKFLDWHRTYVIP